MLPAASEQSNLWELYCAAVNLTTSWTAHRFSDMANNISHQNANCVPLFIIEGPKAPENLDPFYQLIVDELNVYAPGASLHLRSHAR